MKLSDFVVQDAILVDLQATAKPEAIREIIQSLVDSGHLDPVLADDVAKKILDREALGSTGIGRSVAVPHTRHDRVDRLIGTVAISRKGVKFEALDGEPVDVFFLLVSPSKQPGDHLRALEYVSTKLHDAIFVSFLRQAKTREQVMNLLDEADRAAN